MLRKFLFVLFCSILGFNLACGSATAPNGNANAVNSAVTNQKLPEGISTSPMPVSGNTPGIPANVTVVNMNAMPKGATPIPGIDPKKANQPLKPGGTPTPGIPDPKTLQKQLNPPLSSQSDSPTRPADVNAPANKPPTVKKP